MGIAIRRLIHQALLWAGAAAAAILLLYFHSDIATRLGINQTLLPTAMRNAPQPVAADANSEQDGNGTVRITADSRGHYATRAKINGASVQMMVDTGATLVMLSYEDAERLGLSPQGLDFSGRVQTANGITRIAPIHLASVRLGDIVVHNVPAAVAERGALGIDLLGMSFLRRLANFEIHDNQLILTR